MAEKQPCDALLFFPSTCGYSTSMLLAIHKHYCTHSGTSEWIPLPAYDDESGILILRNGLNSLLGYKYTIYDLIKDKDITYQPLLEQLRRNLDIWFRGIHDQVAVPAFYGTNFNRYDHTVIVVHTQQSPRNISFQRITSLKPHGPSTQVVLYPGDILIPSKYALSFFSTLPLAMPSVMPLSRLLSSL